MSKKSKKKLKKVQLTTYPIRDYPENSQIWYGSPPHHYKYPHGWIKDEAHELKSKNKVIKMEKRGSGLKVSRSNRKPKLIFARKKVTINNSNNIMHKLSIDASQSSKNKLAANKTLDLICGFCGVNFNSSEELSRHMKIHPKCTLCGKRMLNEETLKKHVQGLL